MARPRQSVDSTCPFINRNDGRCAERFSLRRLEQAFDLCLYGHRACPTFYELAREQERERRGLTIHITVEGRVPPAGLGRSGLGAGPGERDALAV